MEEENPLQTKLEQHKERYDFLMEKRGLVQKQYDTDTHADDKFRSKNKLKDLDLELGELEAEMHQTEQQFNEKRHSGQLKKLQDELAQLRRNKAYQEALDVARQIQVLVSDSYQITHEVSELQQRLELSTNGQEVFNRLTVHFSELTPIIADLAQVLSAHNEHEHTQTITIVAERFLDQQMPANEFIDFCQNLLKAGNTSTDSSNQNDLKYKKIATSIYRGRTVLFLGSGVPYLYDQHSTDENELAARLADEINYPDFSGGLSSIAEYYQLTPGFGRNSLLQNLHKSLPNNLSGLSLYESLARINTHLVVMSAAYDTLLENAFIATNKPYVEIASIVIAGTGDYKLGNVILRYSDSGKEEICSKESLSELSLLKNYSIIYKLRGSCGESHINGDAGWRHSLTLSESNYFTFAESAGRIIPDYITRQFLDRELLFLGFTPANWEDRLLARTLLSKRQNHPEPCYTIGKASDPLQSVFWEKQKVQQYEMEFAEFDRHLQEATQ